MTAVFHPQTPVQLAECVAEANRAGRTLEIVGRGGKRSLGRPVAAEALIDMSACTGLLALSPEEGFVSARAGTLLEEIEVELLRRNFRLGFEAADWGPLLGAEPGIASIGGIIATAAAGPRAATTGGIGRHLLGATGVTGAGESFACRRGGEGPDLTGLMPGSMGTLAVLAEVTLAIAAHPEAQRTLCLVGLAPGPAVEMMESILAGPIGVNGAAHLPAGLTACSSVPPVFQAGDSLTAFRLEGDDEWVAGRALALHCVLGRKARVVELSGHFSAHFWREIRDVMAFVGDDRVVWRLDAPPRAMAEATLAIQAVTPAEILYDRGGALAWAAFDEAAPDGWEALVRGAMRGAGGRATLFRGTPELRRAVAPFPLAAGEAAALSGRLKSAMDPGHILNPGRLGHDTEPASCTPTRTSTAP